MLPSISSHWTGHSVVAYSFDHPAVANGTLVRNAVEFVEFATHWEGKRRMVLCLMMDGRVIGPPLSH